ncbi:MAG: hypothetical protein OXF96_03935, partial [Chloroflexi bacterium]|nr:hypothetical protein [Chloroflexota bacterium]
MSPIVTTFRKEDTLALGNQSTSIHLSAYGEGIVKRRDPNPLIRFRNCRFAHHVSPEQSLYILS